MKAFINFVLLYVVVGLFCIVIAAMQSLPIFYVIGICFIIYGFENYRKLKGK